MARDEKTQKHRMNRTLRSTTPTIQFLAIIGVVLFSLVRPVRAEVIEDLGPNPGSNITIYVYPPYQPLNWSTPNQLFKSFMRIRDAQGTSKDPAVKIQSDYKNPDGTPETSIISSKYVSTMGHALVRVSCVLPNKTTYTKWTSLSGADSYAFDKELLFDKKVGFGNLFFDYPDGHLISGEENAKRLIHYKGTQGHPRYLSMIIRPAACEAIKGMIDKFESFHYPKGTTMEALLEKARLNPTSVLYYNRWDPYERYKAYLKDKNERLGGGCAPFAYGLMKVANTASVWFDRVFRRTIPVSERLIGGITSEPGKQRSVDILSILLAIGDRWHHEGYKDRMATFVDPQMMWDFIGEVNSCLKNGSQCSYSVVNWDRYQATGGVRTGYTQVLTDVDFHRDHPGLPYFQNIEGIVVPLARDRSH